MHDPAGRDTEVDAQAGLFSLFLFLSLFLPVDHRKSCAMISKKTKRSFERSRARDGRESRPRIRGNHGLYYGTLSAYGRAIVEIAHFVVPMLFLGIVLQAN